MEREFLPNRTQCVAITTHDKGTLHSCDDALTCPTPAWWLDHCAVYDLFVTYTQARTQLDDAIAEVAADIAYQLMPDSGPGQGELFPTANPTAITLTRRNAIDKATRKIATAWLSRVSAGEDVEPFTAFAAARLNTALPADTRDSLPATVKVSLPSQRCRHTAQHLPAGSPFTCATVQTMRQVRDVEATLTHYYLPRAAEAVRKTHARYVVDEHEKDLVWPAAMEGLLAALRAYDLAKEVPMQAYLRTVVPYRLMDTINLGRSHYKARRTYTTVTHAAMEADPSLSSRLDAAVAAGWDIRRALLMETIIATSQMSHSIHTSPSTVDDEVGDFEANWEPLFPNDDLTAFDPADVASVRAAMKRYTREERDALDAFAADRLDTWLDERGVTRARGRAAWTDRCRTMMAEVSDFVHARHQDSAPSKEADSRTELASLGNLTPEQRRDLVHGYVHGNLTAVAHNLAVSEEQARRWAITMLETARRNTPHKTPVAA
jgi:hypothetical protein